MHDFPVADGDIARRQQTITTLYSDHHSWLHGWLRKKLGCSQHAADLAHDAFIRILLLADPHTIKEPRAFLATTAGRLMIGAKKVLHVGACSTGFFTSSSATPCDRLNIHLLTQTSTAQRRLPMTRLQHFKRNMKPPCLFY